MKKAGVIILIVAVATVYFVREGKKATLNCDGTGDKNLSMMDYFFKGINSTLDKMSPHETTLLMKLSNFCFRTIVK